jgi:hypothetical protein
MIVPPAPAGDTATDRRCSSTALEPITLPAWVAQWPTVETEVRRIEAQGLTADARAVLERLATDGRMCGVWIELNRHSRTNGGFLHPVSAHPDDRHLPADEAQAKALAEVLNFTFLAASERASVKKQEDVDRVRAAFLDRASTLRETADYIVKNAPAFFFLPTAYATSPGLAQDDAAAMLRAADWFESIAAPLLTPDDPMMVENERGDRVARGVPIRVATFLRERFGALLYGTAATIASVALDEPTNVRAIRSAFSPRKPD